MKIFAQLQREVQEYRASLLITPLAVAGMLVLLMLGSVILAGRVSIIGDGVMQVLMHQKSAEPGVSISININDDGSVQTSELQASLDAMPEAAADEWNFSREWTFKPGHRRNVADELEAHLDSLNPVLHILNVLFLVLLFGVSVNYLLGTLYQDRKDRSILFWKSLPVSEWQEVLCKLAVGSLLAPLFYLVASVLTQIAYVLLAMLLVWRMDGDVYDLILANIEFVPLFTEQIAGILVWILWTVPVYAWLLVASAAARRSPFMIAFGLPLGLIFVERVFIGSNYLAMAIFNHLPHMVDDDAGQSMGMYLEGPLWAGLDYVGMLLGMLVAAGLVSLAVWLRRHRFEI